MVITWKNIGQSDTNAGSAAMRTGGEYLNKGLKRLEEEALGVSARAKDKWDLVSQENTDAMISNIRAISNLDDYNAAVAAGTFGDAAGKAQYGHQVDMGQVRTALEQRDDDIVAGQKTDFDRNQAVITQQNTLRAQAEAPEVDALKLLVQNKDFKGAREFVNKGNLSGKADHLAAIDTASLNEDNRLRQVKEQARLDENAEQAIFGEETVSKMLSTFTGRVASNSSILEDNQEALGYTLVNGRPDIGPEPVAPVETDFLGDKAGGFGPAQAKYAAEMQAFEAKKVSVARGLQEAGVQRVREQEQAVGELKRILRERGLSEDEITTYTSSFREARQDYYITSPQYKADYDEAVKGVSLEAEKTTKAIETKKDQFIKAHPSSAVQSLQQRTEATTAIHKWLMGVSPDETMDLQYGDPNDRGGLELRRSVQTMMNTPINGEMPQAWMMEAALAANIETDNIIFDEGADIVKIEETLKKLMSDPTEKENIEAVNNYMNNVYNPQIAEVAENTLLKTSAIAAALDSKHGAGDMTGTNALLDTLKKAEAKSKGK